MRGIQVSALVRVKRKRRSKEYRAMVVVMPQARLVNASGRFGEITVRYDEVVCQPGFYEFSVLGNPRISKFYILRMGDESRAAAADLNRNCRGGRHYKLEAAPAGA